jgi:spore germination cell wall hydrolase CwlJ-like protein
MTPIDVVALTIYGEARGEPIEGQIAVANVIRNRVRDGRWGPGYTAVCQAPHQFSCWTPEGGLSNFMIVDHLRQALDRGAPLPDDPTLKACVGIAHALDAWIPDTVRGATHYYADWLKRPPAWAKGHSPVALVGHHLFFRGIR